MKTSTTPTFASKHSTRANETKNKTPSPTSQPSSSQTQTTRAFISMYQSPREKKRAALPDAAPRSGRFAWAAISCFAWALYSPPRELGHYVGVHPAFACMMRNPCLQRARARVASKWNRACVLHFAAVQLSDVYPRAAAAYKGAALRAPWAGREGVNLRFWRLTFYFGWSIVSLPLCCGVNKWHFYGGLCSVYGQMETELFAILHVLYSEVLTASEPNATTKTRFNELLRI